MQRRAAGGCKGESHPLQLHLLISFIIFFHSTITPITFNIMFPMKGVIFNNFSWRLLFFILFQGRAVGESKGNTLFSLIFFMKSPKQFTPSMIIIVQPPQFYLQGRRQNLIFLYKNLLRFAYPLVKMMRLLFYLMSRQNVLLFLA